MKSNIQQNIGQGLKGKILFTLLILLGTLLLTTTGVRAEDTPTYLNDIKINFAESNISYITPGSLPAEVDDTYEISTAAQLAAVAEAVNSGTNSFENKEIILTADINLGGSGLVRTIVPIGVSDTYNLVYSAESGGINNAWKPIGNSETNGFKGTFDGRGHEITNMLAIHINGSDAYAGLFGYVDGGTINNLGIGAGSQSLASSSFSSYGGGVAGSVVSQGSISNCYNTSAVSSYSFNYSYGGGVAGSVDGSTSNCYNMGAVSSSSYYSCGGGVAGKVSGSISNCYNTGVVSFSATSFSYGGGVAGRVNSGSISNCYNTSAVSSSSSTFSYGGGVAGFVDSGSISSCYNTGAVSSSIYGGGVAGYVHSGSISKCYNTANVTSKGGGSTIVAGGIAGFKEEVSAEVKDSYYDEGIVISGRDSSLGAPVPGLAVSLGNTNYEKAEVPDGSGGIKEESVFQNIVTDTWEFQTGYGNRPVLKGILANYRAYFTQAGSKITVHVDRSGGDPADYTYQWYSGETLVGGDSDSYILEDDDKDKVISVKITSASLTGSIRLVAKAEYLGAIDVSDLGTSGGATNNVEYIKAGTLPDEVNSTYFISTAAELAAVAEAVNGGTNSFKDKTIILTNDIDLEGAGLECEEVKWGDRYNLIYTAAAGGVKNAWKPIGINEKQFKGTFDGAGHKIKNMLAIDITTGSTVAYAGLFGNVGGGTIKNLGIGDESDMQEASHSLASSSSSSFGGGVVGYVGSGGSISNCYNTGAVASSSSSYSSGGGVVGYVVSNGSISNCYNTGAVSSSSSSSDPTNFSSYGGGVAGSVYSGGGISNCYNTGAVSSSSSSSSGGVAGSVYSGGGISNCYNTGAVSSSGSSSSSSSSGGGVAGFVDGGSISNCYNTGAVSSSSYYSHGGGVAGYLSGGSINNCYNTANVTAEAPSLSNANAGGITGSGSAATSYFDSGITIIGKNNAQGVNVSGLTDSLIGTNYKTAKIDASRTANVFANISENEPPDQRVWTYTEPDQAKNPRLKHLYKNKNLTIAQTGGKLTAALGEYSQFLAEKPRGDNEGEPPKFQWYRDGVEINNTNENQNEYILTQEDAGKRVYVTLTAGNYVAEMYSDINIQYRISIDENIENDEISVDPKTAVEGTVVTVTLKAGYELVENSLKYKKTGDDEDHGTVITRDTENDPYQFTMPGYPVVVTGQFIAQSQIITIDEHIEKDTIKTEPNGEALTDQEVTVIVSPKPGYELVENSLKYKKTGEDSDPGVEIEKDEVSKEYQFTMPGYPVVVTGEFIAQSHEITIDEHIEKDTIKTEPNGEALTDQEVTVIVSPKPGYRLKEGSLIYTKDNDPAGTKTPIGKDGDDYTFVMPADDVTITGEFESRIPTKDNFVYDLTSVTYDGKEHLVIVTPQNNEKMGDITVRHEQKTEEVKPKDVGEYSVFVTTTGSTKWDPVTDLSLGKLEIEPCEIKNASVAIPAVLQDSSDTLEDQTLTISSDSIVAGDAVKATCDVSFDSGTDKVGAFDTATVTVKTINNPNYSLSGELKGQSYEVIAKTLQSIAITGEPDKLTYFVGDRFDPTGMEVTATYDSGDVVLKPGDYQITPDGPLTLGTTEVTISYGGQTATQTIVVKAVELESISIATKPSKLEYYAGESFDASGLVIKRAYNNGKEDTLAYADAQTEFSFQPTLTTALTTENKSVEIGYGGKTAIQAINVVPKPVDTYSLSGTVVGEGNVGLVGAKVTLSGVKNLFTTTGEGGSFKLEQIPAGEYTLLVEADGYQERFQKLVVSGDQQDLAVTLEKRPEDTFTLTVHATTTDDKPLAGASVSVQGQDTKTTDAEGRVSFDKLKAGTYSVKVSCDGYSDKAEDVKVVNEDISLHLALEAVAPPEYKVSGIITDSETKQALAGVEVTCGNKTAQTDDKGVYTIEGLVAGQYVLTAKAGGYPDTQIGFEIVAGDVQVDLALEKVTPTTYSLNGKVLGENGQPLEKVEVTLTKGKAAPLTTQSDENGEYRFTDLENGTYTLTIDQEGYAPYLKEVKIEGLSRQQDIHLQKNRFPIAGNITGPDKAPIPNAGIKLVDGQGDVLAEVTTDAQGHFILGDIPNGNYLLVVSAAGYEERQTQITVNGNPITTALALDLLTYSITDESGANGAIEISGKGQAGETITLKVKPDAGYRLVENSLAANAGAIALTPVDDYYTFIMPGEDVRITASFEAIPNHDATQTPGTIGRGADAVFKFNGDLSALLDVTLIHENGSEYPFVLTPEGQLVRLTHDNDDSGKAESGSVIVTLYAHWLAKLPGGRYTLVLGFADGSERGMGSGDFVLTGEPKTEPAPAPVTPAKPQNPSTGDPRADVLALLALALIGAAGALWSGRRRRV